MGKEFGAYRYFYKSGNLMETGKLKNGFDNYTG